ncbi:FAD:protein FMN transferase [Actinomycetospora chibensis]|uniref:FAD:protein FMN transferase n=1 Tax=Actinomycetospora chibensis TaxID=663606 RepID=A0ABV9RLJ5_9PSEU|nr:FAD:protein FMN transferase [Actinomycetospora chibensis]MDD7922686.1 FAD:protein FMN transferase [Actinomycetospora chibensis]
MTAPTPARPRITRYVEHVMGLPISLALRGRHADDTTGRSAWRAVMATLREADRVFSTYRRDSVVSRINRSEVGLGDPGVPSELHDVLDIADRAGRATDGAFSVWLPGPDGERHLDPSGVVKGWAVERAAAALRALDDTDFCLGAGGDVLGRALDPDLPWRIGIEDPHDPRRLLATVPVRDGAVATSGTAHRGAHVIDVRTALPPTGIAAVTVIASTLTVADVDATAAFALGADAAEWLGRRVGRSGLVVASDGTVARIPRVGAR